MFFTKAVGFKRISPTIKDRSIIDQLNIFKGKQNKSLLFVVF